MGDLTTDHLRRYRDISWLLWKHGRSEWAQSSGLDRHVKETFEDENSGPEALASDLESLGPTFIKIGQMLASRADLLPPEYLEALARLQDDVAPLPFESIERVIADELDVRPSRAFQEIDPSPMATASLAQVHRATLRDGRSVVIKVQRPDIDEQIRVDFEAFASIARLASLTTAGKRYQFEGLVEEFRNTMTQELDYVQEAQNLLALSRNLQEFKRIHIPKPIIEFSSRRVLVMERCDGASIAELSPVVLTEIDCVALADEMFSAYLKQILVDGFFHADPHPGNVLLDRDHRIALIDLGMVGRINAGLRHQLLNLVLAISEGDADRVCEITEHISPPPNDFDRNAFRRGVSELVLVNQQKEVGDLEVGRIVLEIQRISGNSGLRLPANLALVGKTLVNLDTIAKKLAPDFNPNEAIQRHSADLIRRRMRDRVSLGNLFQNSLEMAEIAAQLPKRINEVLTQIGDQGIRLNVAAIDEAKFIRGFHKIANRITSGLIIAALIIGAALIMRVKSEYTLLGYPALAIILFLAAATGAGVLLWHIFFRDRDDEGR